MLTTKKGSLNFPIDPDVQVLQGTACMSQVFYLRVLPGAIVRVIARAIGWYSSFDASGW